MKRHYIMGVVALSCVAVLGLTGCGKKQKNEFEPKLDTE